MAECAFHLIALSPSTAVREFAGDLLSTDRRDAPDILIAGITHGWVHMPLVQDKELLLGHDWDLFVFSKASSTIVADRSQTGVVARVTANMFVPEAQLERLVSERVSALTRRPPPLAAEWMEAGKLRIPSTLHAEVREDPPTAGVLRLDPPMVEFLSSALPIHLREKPVSLFNLFKYPEGNSSVHDQYMHDFADKFGESAGAYVKFLGPLQNQPKVAGGEPNRVSGSRSDGVGWQDADLVHYDSIYHYAYMLSTDVYQRMNVKKIQGLEDTAILLISEAAI